MKLETSERLFVQTLLEESVRSKKIENLDKMLIEKLTGDASTRRYYRVQVGCGSYVVCLDTPREDKNDIPDFLSVQQVLEKSKVRVPRIYDIDIVKGYYLEEDLGDQTFLKHLSQCTTHDEEFELYRKAVDLLGSLHKTDLDNSKNEVFVKRQFDYEKLISEIRFTAHHFMYGLMGHQEDGNRIQEIVSVYEEICERLASQPMVFTHRDYHSRNLMVKDNELVVIDFQDARLGIPQYDLCSLLDDCYYQLENENQKKLIDYYWQNYGRALWPKDFSNFYYYYNLMATQRIFKAIGSFAYIYRVRQDIRYLRHIGRAFERLKAVLFELPEYEDMRKKLAAMYYDY